MLWRLFQALFLTYNMVHPDEYWQAVEVAYNFVYGGVDLPWEWTADYRIRNTVYPFYLVMFLQTLKFTGLDTPWAVRNYPYLAHSLLVIISDRYLWKISCRLIGKPASRIAMLLYFLNRNYNELIIRCFTTSLESVF